MPQVSIVIPCFDEEQTIPRLAVALDGVVAKLEAAGRGSYPFGCPVRYSTTGLIAE
jgi:hypothetical protein